MKFCKIVFLFVFIIIIANVVDAYSNESIEASELIDFAKDCFTQMVEEGLPLSRANESLQDSIQLFSAQIALEDGKRTADYGLVRDYAEEVCLLRDKGIEAHDELEVFISEYEEISKNTNLSEFDDEYLAIVDSYNGERFEETIELIDLGYNRIYEIQSTQTAVNLFYTVTTRTIKDFFIENWKGLSIGGGIIIILLIVFWKGIKKIRVRTKLKSLMIEKKTLNQLIGKLQKSYFGTKDLSEIEYHVKLASFKEMIRDIDRQLPLLNTELLKLEKRIFKERSGGGINWDQDTNKKVKKKRLRRKR